MAEAQTSGQLEREMGIDHADFRRLLPHALGQLRWRGGETRFSIAVGAGEVTIELGPERVRRIALLELPVTPVRFAWEGLAEGEFERFLERFDHYYRRGGG
ncbi:MAG TPA: hypothetical protein VIX81_05250 [Gammaproteobacteria bacterium]